MEAQNIGVCHMFMIRLLTLLVLSASCFCSAKTISTRKDQAIPEPQMASIIFSSKCDLSFLPDGKIDDTVHRVWSYAKMNTPPSDRVSMEFLFERNPEGALQNVKVWGVYGEPNFLRPDLTHPLGPSLIRQKIEIGNPRQARVGNLSFSNCQDFILDTDFGKRRTIECGGVGLIAEDHYSTLESKFYPYIRIVGIGKVPWDGQRYKDMTKRRQYYYEVIEQLQKLSQNYDFLKPCQINFLDILKLDS